jgi:hypothetical protein
MFRHMKRLRQLQPVVAAAGDVSPTSQPFDCLQTHSFLSLLQKSFLAIQILDKANKVMSWAVFLARPR